MVRSKGTQLRKGYHGSTQFTERGPWHGHVRRRGGDQHLDWVEVSLRRDALAGRILGNWLPSGFARAALCAELRHAGQRVWHSLP